MKVDQSVYTYLFVHTIRWKGEFDFPNRTFLLPFFFKYPTVFTNSVPLCLFENIPFCMLQNYLMIGVICVSLLSFLPKFLNIFTFYCCFFWRAITHKRSWGTKICLFWDMVPEEKQQYNFSKLWRTLHSYENSIITETFYIFLASSPLW